MTWRQRARVVTLRGEAEHHAAGVALLRNPGDLALIRRGRLRTAILRCPDGCGADITLNLDPRAGKAWRLYRTRRGLTLYPSVWRDSGCGAHFILWNDRIIWCDVYGDFGESADEDLALDEKALALLQPDIAISFVEIADKLQVIPWAALRACERLVTCGKARAEPTPRQGLFRKA